MGLEGKSGANGWRLADGVNSEESMTTAVRKHFGSKLLPPSSLPCKSSHTTAGKYSWTDLRIQVGKREPTSSVTAYPSLTFVLVLIEASSTPWRIANVHWVGE